MTLLNKGLNYTPAPSKVPLHEIAVGIEAAIEKCSIETKSIVRSTFKDVIDNKKNNTKEHLIIKRLKKKDVVYSRSDKGKGVVIMNKKDQAVK